MDKNFATNYLTDTYPEHLQKNVEKNRNMCNNSGC